jgi:adenine phosphoribosyltransferase
MGEQNIKSYTVSVAGLTRELPLFEIAPSVRIAIVNILGDTELVMAASKELSRRLLDVKPDAVITAEAKSIPLAYAIGAEMGIAWIILRKSWKPYMGKTLEAETFSITTGHSQTLYLDEKDQVFVQGKRIALIDDVISTGSTLQGMRMLVEKAGGKVVASAAIFTEGDRAKWQDILSLGHLPVFTE